MVSLSPDCFFFFMILGPPRSTLFPYTTLFRSLMLPVTQALSGKAVLQGISPLGAKEMPCSTDRKSTRLNSSHTVISYAVFCLKKKKKLKVMRDECYLPINHGIKHARRDTKRAS